MIMTASLVLYCYYKCDYLNDNFIEYYNKYKI